MPIKENSQNPLEAILSGNAPSGRKHPVPQNVMDVEFKVVGDLTLRQLAYVFLGLIIGYFFYKIGLPTFWSWTLLILSGLGGAAIAFIPFEERGLDKWLVLFIHAMFSQQPQMIWKKSSNTPIYFLNDYASIIKNEIITLTPVKSRNKLEEYLGMLPEEHDLQDLYSRDKMNQLSETFAYVSPNGVKLATNIELKVQPEERVVPIGDPVSLSSPISRPIKGKNLSNPLPPKAIQTSVITKEPEQNVSSQKPTQSNTPPAEPKVRIVESQPIEKPVQQTKINQPITPVIFPETKPAQTAVKETKPESNLMPQPEVRIQQQPKPVPAVPEQKSITIEETPIDNNLNNIIKEEIESKQEVAQAFITQKVEVLPNAQVDRPIKNWPTALQDQLKGEIKLRKTPKLPPIMVAQDIKSIKEKEENLAKKVQELLEVAARARDEFEAKGLKIENNPKIDFYKTKFEELQKEKQTLSTEIDKNTSRVEMLDGQKQQKPLEKQVEDLTERNQELEQKLQMIQEQLFESARKQQVESQPQTQPKSKTTTQPVVKTTINTGSGNSIDYGPNILAGITKDQKDNLLENTVVLIKDSHGNVVRALKTNKLGQFKTQTPLNNGDYLIEAVKAGESFDIIRISAIGKDLPLVEIVSKGKTNEQ